MRHWVHPIFVCIVFESEPQALAVIVLATCCIPSSSRMPFCNMFVTSIAITHSTRQRRSALRDSGTATCATEKVGRAAAAAAVVEEVVEEVGAPIALSPPALVAPATTPPGPQRVLQDQCAPSRTWRASPSGATAGSRTHRRRAITPVAPGTRWCAVRTRRKERTRSI